MSERLSSTAHGDAPLSAAYKPDATAAALWATEEDDELSARTVTINRSIADLYAFVRDPANLSLLWGEMGSDWSSVNIQEEVGRAVVWHAGSDDSERFSGRIDLRPAPASRGTEVTVTLATPSRNALHRLWDKVTSDDPRIQCRRALRRFKQLMETGEVATTTPGRAAPRA